MLTLDSNSPLAGESTWNPVNTVTNGLKKFGRNNWVTVFRGFLYRRPKTSGRNNEVAVRPASARLVRNYCVMWRETSRHVVEELNLV